MRADRCVLCNGDVVYDGGLNPCSKCCYAENAYYAGYPRWQHQARRGRGDAEYIYHELGHAVILRLRVPARSRWRLDEWIGDRVERMGVAVAQRHEVHVLALQHIVFKDMGWPCSVEKTIDRSWPQISDALYIDDKNGGRGQVLRSRSAALAYLRQAVNRVSPHNARRYRRLVEAIRGG